VAEFYLKITFTQGNTSLYGLEFSANGKYLYVGNFSHSNPGIFQYDLSSGDSATILQSKYFFSTREDDHDINQIGALSMGPDGKIYFVQTHSCYENYVSCIPYPNLPAPDCGLFEKIIKLAPGTKTQLGLPNVSQAIYDKPDISVFGKCVPGDFTFIANICGEDSLHWYIEDSLLKNSTDKTIETKINSSGNKIIKAIVFYSNSADTLLINYNFLDFPKMELPKDTVLCPDKEIIIKAKTDANKIIWSNGETTKSISISSAGKYFATAINTIGCKTMDSIFIKGIEKPEFYFSVKAFCEDSPAIVKVLPLNLNEKYELIWSNGEKDSMYSYYYSEGFEYLTLIDTNNCEFTDSFFVNEKCPSTLFIPNAFSPNGDGLNEKFEVAGSFIVDFQIQIYNRWGEKIFESQDINNSWNGKFKGEKVPLGIYYYQIFAKGIMGKEIKRSGMITVVR
ncbi:MAG: gliding motility-associated C-terminal domain-containing protein, partial [Bacteroidota bacterium]|nr:gliding motility-associated C-terminal domain-containing protein [Bacteroidota bacterium]